MKPVQLKRGRMFRTRIFAWVCIETQRRKNFWSWVVHGVAKSRTRLSDFTFNFHIRALEKEMATHYSILTWRIPGMGEPGGLPSMGSHRVGHNWSDLAAADWMRYRFYPWKRDVGQIKSSILNVLSLRCLFNIQRRAVFVSLEFWSRLECSA